MAALALTDAFLFVDGFDFTSKTNQLNLDVQHDTRDATPFGSQWRQLVVGVTTSTIGYQGFWDTGATAAVDPAEFSALGTRNRVVTFGPSNTEGGVAYMLRTTHTNYTTFGEHGEVAPFTVAGTGSDSQGVVRGRLLVDSSSVSATGAVGSGVQVGAVGADEYLYATFHVLTAGTTITAVVESDDNASFTSATTRATFSTITAKGGSWATRVAGAITDDYWRVRVTAVTGTFTIAAAVGIQ